ncbi:MAG: arylsulfatase [Planctomycetota bacterium]|jgi:arylsulfatase
MKRTTLVAVALALFVGMALSLTASADSHGRPNIILIMADDMGFSDIGCYGGEIETPTLDALASGGLRFTQFYNTGRCCPTRASLLTGLYPHQAGVGWMTADNGYDGYRGDLNRNCVTIAEALKTVGYATYMSGKWHVTKDLYGDQGKANWPRQRGFDRFFGTIFGAGSFYDPSTLTLENERIVPDRKNFYYTDRISDYAVDYIKDHKGDEPFFMYVAYTAPHWPMHALPEDIAKYKGRYDEGWDVLRAERHQRMIDMGLVSDGWPLTPRDPNAKPWSEIKMKKWNTRRMEVYAAMVDRLDQGIGRIVDQLKQSGRFDNTLILFLADNGGCAEEYGSGKPYEAPKQPAKLQPMGPNEFQDDMAPRFTRDGRPVRQGWPVMPGPADTYIAYGKPWANASNTPFREYKHWVHEGGIATPLIAHWPAQIKRRGQLEHQPGHLIDVMATCVEIANVDYPTSYKGAAIKPLEGRSLTPAFSGKKIQREALYWEHEGNRAVRVGQWKLVAKGEKGPWELYDLEADRTELNDLSQKHPDRAKKLADMWLAYAERANVLPLEPRKKK